MRPKSLSEPTQEGRVCRDRRKTMCGLMSGFEMMGCSVPLAALFVIGASLDAAAAASMPLRDDLGNMSMTIDTADVSAQRYFNQGLRFTAAFKFDYAAASHQAALALDPSCAMCEWGLAVAYGQNLNDALVMSLEPEFLANEPLAFEAVSRAEALLFASSDHRNETRGPRQARDRALVSALRLKFCPTVEEYTSFFVDGLPAALNIAYAEEMALAATKSEEEAWPDFVIVLVLSADAWMNLSPWDYWVNPHTMRPHAASARRLLETAMSLDPSNPWAIHLYTHLMEAGAEAAAAVSPAQKLEHLVPGAPHLQHMQSHVEFRTGGWHQASEANKRAVALPDSDAAYPDHNMDMLMWSLGVEGRTSESKEIGERLTAYTIPRILEGISEPLLPPERYLAQEALHLAAFGDWRGVRALHPPPENAEFPMAVYRFATSLAFVEAKEWGSYSQEQALITAEIESMEGRMDYYGIYNAPVIARILGLLSRAEALRGGIERDEEASFASETTLGASSEELNLLRQAVQLEDSLGYDEPPQLPVPARLYLGAALLRPLTLSQDTFGLSAESPPVHTAVEEAEAVFIKLEQLYPDMGRTLLGLSITSTALGKATETHGYRRRLDDSWRYAEVQLEDSAHIKQQHLSTDPTHGGAEFVVGSGSNCCNRAYSSSDNATVYMASTVGPPGAEWADKAATSILAMSAAFACLSLAMFVTRARILKGQEWRRQQGLSSTQHNAAPTVAAAAATADGVSDDGSAMHGDRGYRSFGETDALMDDSACARVGMSQ